MQTWVTSETEKVVNDTYSAYFWSAIKIWSCTSNNMVFHIEQEYDLKHVLVDRTWVDINWLNLPYLVIDWSTGGNDPPSLGRLL